MNFFAASAFITMTVCVAAGALVLFVNPRNPKNLTFIAHTAPIVLWMAFYTLWQMARTPETALFWVRLQMIACAFIPVTNYHYVLTLFDATTRLRRAFLWVLYFLAAALGSFGFSPWFIPRVEPRLFFPFWPVPGPLIHILFATLPIPIIMSMRLIWERKNTSSPFLQNKLKWLLLGMTVAYAGGSMNCYLWYNIPIPPYGTSAVAFYFPIASFLYFKLGLVDFNLFVRESLSHLTAAVLAAAGLALVVYPFFSRAETIMLLLLASLLAPFLYRRTAPLVRRWTSARYLGALDKTLEQIRETTYTYDDLARNIVGSALRTFPIEMAAVYFYDLSRKELPLRAQKGMRNPLTANLRFNRSALAISEADPLIHYLASRQSAVSLDALRNDINQNETARPVVASLERIEAEICSPFLFDGKVKGLLILSRKKDNTMFNKDDFEAIQAFASMGGEIMRYIMGMETELRHSSQVSHDIDNDLRSLVQTLEFVLSPMAQRQSPEKSTSLLEKAKAVAEHTRQLFQSNRDRSNLIMKSVRGEYEKTPLDITKAVRSSAEKFQLMAGEKQINLTVSIPEEQVTVLGNFDDLIRVTDNLISNAFRYVPAGGTISFEAARAGDWFQIVVRDNGQGIAPPDLEKIWDLGWQSKEGHRGAAGLGLAIVKQIVELHNGDITASSRGVGT